MQQIELGSSGTVGCKPYLEKKYNNFQAKPCNLFLLSDVSRNLDVRAVSSEVKEQEPLNSHKLVRFYSLY